MKFFSLDELTYSLTATTHGIDNTPNDVAKSNLHYLVDQLLDPLRDYFGAPIVVQSGYRCPALNQLVDGVPTSYHCKGLAADISSLGQNRVENARLYSLLLDSLLPFDQIIQYDVTPAGPRWLHVSLQRDRPNRFVLLKK